MTEARKQLESLFAAFNRGDIPTVIASVAEECTLRGSLAPGLPYSGVFKGAQGAGQYFSGIAEALAPNGVDVDLYVSEGEHVVAVGSWSDIAKASGKPFKSPLALYFRFRNGKMIDFRGHEDTGVTLAAMRS